MEKSITEHPEFEKDGQRNLELFEGTILDAREMFDAGGEAAQTILQKQHDEESGFFARWLAERTIYDPSAGWLVNDKNGVTLGRYYQYNELLQLFRKETVK